MGLWNARLWFCNPNWEKLCSLSLGVFCSIDLVQLFWHLKTILWVKHLRGWDQTLLELYLSNYFSFSGLYK
jgi:hypothetical protein